MGSTFFSLGECFWNFSLEYLLRQRQPGLSPRVSDLANLGWGPDRGPDRERGRGFMYSPPPSRSGPTQTYSILMLPPPCWCCWTWGHTLRKLLQSDSFLSLKKNDKFVLTSMAQLVERCPEKRKVAVQMPGFWAGPGWGLLERQPIDVSLPLFLPPYPPL